MRFALVEAVVLRRRAAEHHVHGLALGHVAVALAALPVAALRRRAGVVVGAAEEVAAATDHEDEHNELLHLRLLHPRPARARKLAVEDVAELLAARTVAAARRDLARPDADDVLAVAGADHHGEKVDHRAARRQRDLLRGEVVLRAVGLPERHADVGLLTSTADHRHGGGLDQRIVVHVDAADTRRLRHRDRR